MPGEGKEMIAENCPRRNEVAGEIVEREMSFDVGRRAGARVCVPQR